MGRIRSKINDSPRVISGVQLGDPTILDAAGNRPGSGDMIGELYFVWDDESLPNAEIDAAGNLIPL